MSENESTALIGRIIAGKFVVDAVIAVGGVGTVYRARQLALDRTVALKVLHDDIAKEQDLIERFKREARAASRLDHPNSVRVLDFGQHEGSLLYLAMEYVEGRTLFDVIQDEWPLTEQRMVDIMSQVLSAVAVAHDMEVVHRDLKPENIMIIRSRGDDGETSEVAKVCDFGLATLGALVHGNMTNSLVGGPRVTTRGFLLGTPEYMSPEQARGEPAERRSDIYSAGIVLYQLLTGKVPFSDQSAVATAVKQITQAPLPPSQLTRVNPELEAICLKALSKAPGDRFGSAREMRAALRAVVDGAAAAAATPAPAPRRRRTAMYAGLASAGIFLLAFVTTLIIHSGRRDPPLQFAQTASVPPQARAAVPSAPPPAATAAPPTAPQGPPPAAPPEPLPALPAEAPPAEPVAESPPARRRKAPVRRKKHLRPARTSRAAQRPAAASVAVAPAAPEPPSLPPAPEPPLDIERARVSITGIATNSGIPGGNIRAAMSRIPLLGCYRDALRARGTGASGTATLRLHIDVAGYVTAATLQNAQFLPALKECIERATRSARVKDVDTGEATADVTLSFASSP